MEKIFWTIIKNDHVNPVDFLMNAPSVEGSLAETTEWSKDIFDAYQFTDANDTEFLHAFDQAKADYPNADIRTKMVKISATIL